MNATTLRRLPIEPGERGNTLSHLLGFVLSFIGFILLFTWPSPPLGWTQAISFAIFGLSLMLLYLASTLYHAQKEGKLKRFYKYCDHAAIFILIAGTYTPYCLLASQDERGQSILILVWVIAILGIVGKFFLVGRYQILSTLMYLLLGWLSIFNIDFLKTIPSPELNWLIAGGVSYTVGTIFYTWKKLPHSHMIWHFFVLGGSICHYLVVLLHLTK